MKQSSEWSDGSPSGRGEWDVPPEETTPVEEEGFSEGEPPDDDPSRRRGPKEEDAELDDIAYLLRKQAKIGNG